MESFNFGYFKNNINRKSIIRKGRTIANKYIAWKLNKEYYDGKRINGYGGFYYDGRWKEFLPKIIKRYSIKKSSKILDIGCKKGFFLKDLKDLVPGIQIQGIENHKYPIVNSHPQVKKFLKFSNYYDLKYKDKYFDFVFAFNSVYSQNLGDVIKSLKEIKRISKKSYVVLASYSNEEEKRLFHKWTLLGTTVLSKKEWFQLFKLVGYKGDYYFSNAESLGLK
jgi:ubiquinone/menaquinone biosynthesis C-methylase UbiE